MLHNHFLDEKLDLQSVSETQKFSHLRRKFVVYNNFVFSLVANMKVSRRNIHEFLKGTFLEMLYQFSAPVYAL